MLSDLGCDQRSIHSLMALARLSELGRQEAIALVKKIVVEDKVRKPTQFLMGCTKATFNRLTDTVRSQADVNV